MARIRAALRRREKPEPFVLGDPAIDYARRRVTVAGEAVDLTATEYELLRVLSLDAGRIVTYETLLRRIWNGRDGVDAHLAPQARRGRGQPDLDLQRARRRIPHGRTGGTMNPATGSFERGLATDKSWSTQPRRDRN